MDQIVIHLSINYATLPRIQTFFSHLQVSHMGIQITAAYPLSIERSNTAPLKDHIQQHHTTTHRAQNHSNAHEARRSSYKAWNTLCTGLAGSLNRTPSISEQPLTEQGIELSTTVFPGKGETGQRREWEEHGRSTATSLSNEAMGSEVSTGQLAGGG
jgi:hypothetical protein